LKNLGSSFDTVSLANFLVPGGRGPNNPANILMSLPLLGKSEASNSKVIMLICWRTGCVFKGRKLFFSSLYGSFTNAMIPPAKHKQDGPARQ
jgi:outer membrane receptor for monomeric catechols